MPEESVSDLELMTALAKDEPGALEAVIAKWERPLYSFVHRYTQNEFSTRDIVQETFVKVYLKRDTYKFDYPLSSWIFTIAANLCKNLNRWRKRHPEVALEGAPNPAGERETSLLEVLPAEGVLPAQSMEKDEDLLRLKNAVSTLPHDLRTAVLLHHYQDLSYREIAEVVGCSVRGVETRLYRARKLLRKRLGYAEEVSPPSQKKTAPLESGTVLGDWACDA